MSRKLAVIIVVMLFALGSASLVMVQAGEPQTADQVRICHFPGQDSPAGLHDFVAGRG